MRILLVTHGFPPFGVAGVERVSEQSALTLAAAGHVVTVLARRPSAMPRQPRLERTIHRGLPVILISGGGAGHGQFPRHAATLERLYERCLLEEMPDVVLASHLMHHSPEYVSIAHRWGVPVVVELHDFYFACERAHLERENGDLCDGPDGGHACALHCFPGQQMALGRWALRTHLFRRALQRADAVLCPSEFVAQYFTNLFELQPLPRIIGNGIDIAEHGAQTIAGYRSKRTSRMLNLASIGVVIPHKGIHVAVEALRRARLEEVRYTLFGSQTEPYLQNLRRASESIPGLEFRAYGRFESSELPMLLQGVDAVIVPSLVWETYSIAAREAMACGVPVIASRFGALVEAVRDGQNGLLFTPDAPGELASILQTLANEPERLEDLRQGVRSSDWLSAADRASHIAALLEEVCSKRGNQPDGDGEELELRTIRESLERQLA